MQSKQTPEGTQRRPLMTGVVILSLALALLGLAARLGGVNDPDGDVFWKHPTEDGYLMLTAARNLALGKGLSTADGLLPTNGVQPLATFLSAGFFRMVDGDRESGVRSLVFAYTLIAVLAAFLLYLLTEQILRGWPHRRSAALLAAAVWLSSPVTYHHTVNMLETGLYCALVICSMLLFTRWHGFEGAWPVYRCLLFGAVLGLTFLARNDAVFLMLAVGTAHLASSRRGAVGVARRLWEGCLFGSVSVALALPWLLYNASRFGSVVPISGHAYLERGDLGAKLKPTTVALFEHFTLVNSFHWSGVQHWGPFIGLCAVGAVAGCAVAVLAWRRLVAGNRSGTLSSVAIALFAGGLLVFYLAFFDAPHFIRRYLMPLSPFFAVLWGTVAVAAWQRVRGSRFRLALPLVSVLLLAWFYIGSGLADPRPWRKESVFYHELVWIRKNLTPDQWVGAFQSGTVGFFHDRTINLDGKVNQDALLAIQAGTHHQYVAESPVAYLLDWESLMRPWHASQTSEDFEWLVEVPTSGRSFVVLRRRALRPPSPARFPNRAVTGASPPVSTDGLAPAFGAW